MPPRMSACFHVPIANVPHPVTPKAAPLTAPSSRFLMMIVLQSGSPSAAWMSKAMPTAKVMRPATMNAAHTK